MSTKVITITADVSENPALTTSLNDRGVIILVPSTANLDGGVLSVLAKPKGSAIAFLLLDAALTPGCGKSFTIGPGMDVVLTLAGSTNPTGLTVVVNPFLSA